MAVTFYDNLPLNQDIVLDWPLSEGRAALAHDQSPSGSVGGGEGLAGFLWPAQMGQPFYGIYMFRLWEQYISCLAANCLALDFTNGDYSLSCWFQWSVAGVEATQMLMGKYVLDVSGWECYLFSGAQDILTVRHNHAAGATTRTACYSTGWAVNTLHLFGFSRIGAVGQFYRNGVAIPTVHGVGGLIDPESNAANDLRCGVRFSENANWLNGYLGRPRAWTRALTAIDHWQLFLQGNAQ
jgi:hypothetical protein